MSQSISASSAGDLSGFEDKPLLEVENRPLLIVAVSMVAIMQFLDSTIANVALPHMKVSLGASGDTITWVLTSFILSTAIVMPMSGWLSEKLGSRNLFLGATVLFLVTSAACGASTSLIEMVAFRALQGAAAAFIAPMAQTVIFDISPPSKQAWSMSVYGILVMVAPIAGPVLGGYLTESLNWRWVFYVNLPIGVPALMILWFLLPSRPAAQRRLDLAGLFWLALALASFQLMLDRGEQKEWFDSWEIIIETIVSISALWIYLLHNWATRHPLFSRSLFTNPNFIAAMAMMFVVGISNVALSAILPMLYQNVYGYPVMDAGVLMVPRALGALLIMLVNTWLMKVFDFRYLISAGYLLSAISLWLMAGWSLEMGTAPIVWTGLLQGVGTGLLFAPMNVAAFSSIRPEDRPDGSSVLTLVRNLGSSIGISCIVTLLAHNLQTSHADIAANVRSDSLPGVDLAAAVDRAAPLGAAGIQIIDNEVTRQATMIAYIDNFFVLAWLLVGMALLPMIIRKDGNWMK